MVWRAGLCFFCHLLAEIFGAISLRSSGRGRLKETHLSAVTVRGVDRSYIYIVIALCLDGNGHISTIYLGVLIVDGLLLVIRNLYMCLLWTQNSLLGTMEHL